MNDDGLDSELLRLFDAASPPLEDTTFVAATVRRLEKARRARLIRRLIGTLIIMVAAAVIAPYVAQVTLTTLTSPIGTGCVCAALFAWRIARRQFN